MKPAVAAIAIIAALALTAGCITGHYQENRPDWTYAGSEWSTIGFRGETNAVTNVTGEVEGTNDVDKADK